MLVAAPHTLMVRIVTAPGRDDAGRIEQGTSEETWTCLCGCFCHDNSQQREVSVNGRLWVYAYHVVYEGDKVALGTRVRCLDADGATVGEGEVIKNARCWAEGLEGRCDLWLN